MEMGEIIHLNYYIYTITKYIRVDAGNVIYRNTSTWGNPLVADILLKYGGKLKNVYVTTFLHRPPYIGMMPPKPFPVSMYEKFKSCLVIVAL